MSGITRRQLLAASGLALLPGPGRLRAEERLAFQITQEAKRWVVRGSALHFNIRHMGYVSGVEGGSFMDVASGARDLGFGLDIVDWILEPGSDEAYRDQLPGDLPYLFNNAYHGRRPKRAIEGPQICTQARRLQPKIVGHTQDFLAIQQDFTYTLAAPGKKAGSKWEQLLVFPRGKRYFFAADRITSANTADSPFLRIDMPGHIKHQQGDSFEQVYLSYHDGLIPAKEFGGDSAPDERFLYVRDGKKLPRRMIRAYQIRQPKTGQPGPWLAGMTLDPGIVSEGWCHQRGYVCFIQEIGGYPVKAGEVFGAAYLIGFFESLDEMHQVYDEHRGHQGLTAHATQWKLTAQP